MSNRNSHMLAVMVFLVSAGYAKAQLQTPFDYRENFEPKAAAKNYKDPVTATWAYYTALIGLHKCKIDGVEPGLSEADANRFLVNNIMAKIRKTGPKVNYDYMMIQAQGTRYDPSTVRQCNYYQHELAQVIRAWN